MTTPSPRHSTRCSRPSWSATRAPWKGIDDLEIATAEYIDWFNHRRLHGEIGLIPPAEHEDNFYRHNTAATTVAASVPSLH
jgi:putative transposase